MLSRRTFVSLAAASAATPRLTSAQPAPREVTLSGQKESATSFYEKAMSASATGRSAPAFPCWSPRAVA